LYPPHALFAADRRGFEEGRFWFQDAVHYAEPYCPFDALLAGCLAVNFNQAGARRFVVPTSLGVEQRILGEYVYLSPNSITDEATIAARAELCAVRGGYYYAHWDELDRQWREKVQEAFRALEALEVPQLPEVEDEPLITGVASSHRLLVAYDRLLQSFDLFSNYHFELMNLGYGAYLAYYELCREAFPDISETAIAKMVAGIDVVALRPDDELKRLATRAVELGLGANVRGAHDEAELTAALAQDPAGEQWLGEYRRAKDPWFCFSYGNGLYHHHRSWIDDPTLPISMIGSYIERLQAGADIQRPRAAVLAERDRITDGYRALHWGITAERVQDWLRASDAGTDTIRGIAGSPGVVEGIARLIFDVERLTEVEDGEILVAPFTSPSWTPVFGRIAGAVTDAGGIMCHAAVVAREYRLPAVLGTGSATKRIPSGSRIRLDADNGIVTLIDPRCDDTS
jgi:pyruvate,water dikinase